MRNRLITGTKRTSRLCYILKVEMLSDIPTSTIIAFSIASFAIELTPGPNMTYLALVAAREGRFYGFITVLGVALGLAIIGTAAAFGMTNLIQSSPLYYEILRWAGVLFLFYLAYEGWAAKQEANEKISQQKSWSYFNRGLVTNLLNPKAALFYVAVLPTFLTAGPTINQTLILTAVYVLIATLIHVFIVAVAGTLEPFLNNKKYELYARRILSILLATVAIWVLIGTTRA